MEMPGVHGFGKLTSGPTHDCVCAFATVVVKEPRGLPLGSLADRACIINPRNEVILLIASVTGGGRVEICQSSKCIPLPKNLIGLARDM